MITVMIIALAGFILGFVGSMPIAGPISVLVLAQGVANRFGHAIGVAVGGAAAEGIYAMAAFWGFSRYLVRYPLIINASRGITALILLLVGILLIRQSRESSSPPEPTPRGAAGNGVLVGFSIAILNPTLIMTWTAATNVVVSTRLLPLQPSLSIPFSLGVIGGIIGWFAVLLIVVAKYRERFHPQTLDRVIQWMGWAVIMGAGVFFALFIRDLLGANG